LIVSIIYNHHNFIFTYCIATGSIITDIGIIWTF